MVPSTPPSLKARSNLRSTKGPAYAGFFCGQKIPSARYCQLNEARTPRSLTACKVVTFKGERRPEQQIKAALRGAALFLCTRAAQLTCIWPLLAGSRRGCKRPEADIAGVRFICASLDWALPWARTRYRFDADFGSNRPARVILRGIAYAMTWTPRQRFYVCFLGFGHADR